MYLCYWVKCLVILLVSFFVCNCSYNDTTYQNKTKNDNLKAKSKSNTSDSDDIYIYDIVCDLELINKIAADLKVIIYQRENKQISDFVANQKIRFVVKPLVFKGNLLKQRLLEEYKGKDQEVMINSLDDVTLATSVFTISVLYKLNENVSKERIIDCIEMAFGITTVKQLLVGGTVQLLTASTALEIVVAIGKRYLGYIGLAYVIIKFIDCIDA